MSFSQYSPVGGLLVHRALMGCVEQEILPGLNISAASFWSSLEKLLLEFSGENEALLRSRDALQASIDAWYLRHPPQTDTVSSGDDYTAFLRKIGYLVPEGPKFRLEVVNVDPEIAKIPAPQLVVPGDNARFVLNAVNARWGSLLDAYYGTDAGPEAKDGAEPGSSYNPVRGAKVFELAESFLDEYFPLTGGAKYGDAVSYAVSGHPQRSLVVRCANGGTVGLADPAQFVGYRGGDTAEQPLNAVVLKHNSLHVEIVFDRTSVVGSTHPAGVSDVLLESAGTAIFDMEDSVAAVDAEDKARVYSNWCGLMRGTLEASFGKDGKQMVRTMSTDRRYTSATNGSELVLPGRAVLLNRNVGIHLYTDAVLMANTNQPVPESIIDAAITVLAGLHDLKKGTSAPLRNSRSGSLYVVRPKLHGPDEAAMVVRLFTRIEEELGLPANTVKLGIMDEERRTTVNLRECIRAARQRCIFINTGFLDRTGDEIHTCFRAGAVLPKAAIKAAPWRLAYEDWNVDVGIDVGMLGSGQIGKGMWAAPDLMRQMMASKAGELHAGGSTAWVPSPTAATLHAIHYHQVDVHAVQQRIASGGPRAALSVVLQPPLLDRPLSAGDIQRELEDNLQGLIGYIVRWIELGVGCSKVPDINQVGLMEDRATLRISSQLVGNWLLHGLVSRAQVEDALRKMARVVDEQNARSAGYEPLAPEFNNNAFRCAQEIIYNASKCENGLTEHTLAKFRLAEKARRSASKL